MNTYVIALKHDNGYVNIHVTAKDYKTAKTMLCKAENCPERALTLVCVIRNMLKINEVSK